MDLFRETRKFGLSLKKKAELWKLQHDDTSNEPVLYMNRLQGSSTVPISLKESLPDPGPKNENHMMHGLIAGIGVGLIAKFGFGKENSDSLILGLISGAGVYGYMNKYNHDLPFEWKRSH